MNFFGQVSDFLTNGANWRGPDGFLAQLANQVEISALAIASAVVFGVALGAILGHTRRGSFIAVNSANAARAVPSFALVVLIAIQPVIVRLQQGGFIATVLTMFALAVPPVLTNAYTGMTSVDADARDAAIGMGMTAWQVVWRVELPLALPLVMAGVRTAAVEVVATATLGAYVTVPDLGFDIFAGLATSNGAEAFSGAALVAVLALVVDLCLAAAARAVTPAGARRGVRVARAFSP
ncbi:MAG TPA: ABC transporter permease [Acidimicrobiales bacterium]|nr:ABC transporter permease [Acidimicrobiales bacterium]